MKTNRKPVTPYQAIAIVVNTIISGRLLILPRELCTEVGNGSWLMIVVSALVALVIISLYTAVGRRFSDSSLPQYTVKTLGVFGGSMLALLFGASWLIMASLSARIISAVIITAILPRVPLEVGILVMLLLGAHLATKNIATIARVHELLLPLVVGAIFLLVVPSLSRVSLWRLLPLIEPGSLKKLGTGILVGSSSFLGLEIVSLFMPCYGRPELAGRSHKLGILIVAAVALLTVEGCIGVLGTGTLARTQWPTLTLVRMISFHGIFERLEAPFLAMYVIVVFTTIGSMLFGVVAILAQLFKIKSQAIWPYLLVIPAYYLAVGPPNVIAVEKAGQIFAYFRLGLVVFTPLIVLLVAIIRGKEDRPDEKQAEGS